MIRECFKARTGIMFECERLRAIGLDPSTLYPDVTPRPPPLPVGSASYQEVPKKPSIIRRLISLGKSAAASSADPGPVRVGSEEEEDLKDALSPVYDQLKLQRSWWVLEVLPLRLRYQRANNEWVSYVGLVFPFQFTFLR